MNDEGDNRTDLEKNIDPNNRDIVLGEDVFEDPDGFFEGLGEDGLVNSTLANQIDALL
jgi:hypothetical protein